MVRASCPVAVFFRDVAFDTERKLINLRFASASVFDRHATVQADFVFHVWVTFSKYSVQLRRSAAHNQQLHLIGSARAIWFRIARLASYHREVEHLVVGIRYSIVSRTMKAPMVAGILIKENMEILGSDGMHVGFVDHVAGHDAVRLSGDDPDAGGEPHEIPLS
jgi:Uncharacterized protein conserved in bacteria (DUF2171)